MPRLRPGLFLVARTRHHRRHLYEMRAHLQLRIRRTGVVIVGGRARGGVCARIPSCFYRPDGLRGTIAGWSLASPWELSEPTMTSMAFRAHGVDHLTALSTIF